MESYLALTVECRRRGGRWFFLSQGRNFRNTWHAALSSQQNHEFGKSNSGAPIWGMTQTTEGTLHGWGCLQTLHGVRLGCLQTLHRVALGCLQTLHGVAAEEILAWWSVPVGFVGVVAGYLGGRCLCVKSLDDRLLLDQCFSTFGSQPPWGRG